MIISSALNTPSKRQTILSKAVRKSKVNIAILLLFSGLATAQVQTQSTSAYDSTPPEQSQLEYEVPPVSERSNLLQDNTKVAVTKLELYEIIPQGNEARKRLVTDFTVNDKMAEFLGEFKGQVSFNELRRIANELTQYYRGTGELLTRVFIPAQTVKDGVFTLAVLKGTLGKVNVSGNQSIDTKVFQDAFKSQRGQVIQRDAAESALLRVQNLLPGVSSIGVFSPGDSLGQSDITIEITGEDKTSGYAFIDNHGSAFTGEFRAGIHVDNNNFFGIRDKLSIDIIANEKPEGNDESARVCCIGGFKYEALTSSLQHSFGIEAFRTTYDVGDVGDLSLAALLLSGESTRTRLFGTFHQTVSRATTTSYSYGFSNIKAENFVFDPNLQTNRNTSLDELAELDVAFQFTNFTKGGSVYYGKVLGVLEVQDGVFSLPSEFLGYDSEANEPKGDAIAGLAPSRVGANNGDSFRITSDLNAIYKVSEALRFKVRLNAQFSDDILVAVQQISLAGPTAVRAYPSGAYVADKGAVLSADFIYNVSPYAAISAFFDAAHGQKNAIDDANREEIANFGGYGLGLELRYKNTVTFNLTAAWAHNVDENDLNLGQGGREAAGRDKPQVFGSLVVKF